LDRQIAIATLQNSINKIQNRIEQNKGSLKVVIPPECINDPTKSKTKSKTKQVPQQTPSKFQRDRINITELDEYLIQFSYVTESGVFRNLNETQIEFSNRSNREKEEIIKRKDNISLSGLKLKNDIIVDNTKNVTITKLFFDMGVDVGKIVSIQILPKGHPPNVVIKVKPGERDDVLKAFRSKKIEIYKDVYFNIDLTPSQQYDLVTARNKINDEFKSNSIPLRCTIRDTGLFQYKYKWKKMDLF
jgi:hypothetical protein